MDNVCYFLAVKFRVCQSGVPIVSEKVYTNLSSSTVIDLYYGYTINVARASNDSLAILINNQTLNFSLNFTINNGETILIDLPLDGGTLKVILYASARCCALT
ncbi:MAG: hypothetical protein IKL68_02335 [Clostridia bacterium]|nr:hypothetical protein [Clostridia bacterium]